MNNISRELVIDRAHIIEKWLCALIKEEAQNVMGREEDELTLRCRSLGIIRWIEDLTFYNTLTLQQ